MHVSAEIWEVWVPRIIHVAVILAGSWLLTRLVKRLLKQLRTYAIHMVGRRGGGSANEADKRAATLIAVLGKLSSVVIWLIAIVMALNELTFHIEPLLAGLGVAGLALGLGAQSLIKDWLGGIFLLLEDQLRIGDSVTINGFSGSVEEINFRTTLLRGENGAVHVIPNGSISALSNFTREYSYYVFAATVPDAADVDRTLAKLKQIGDELAADEHFRGMILAPIEGIGIDRLVARGAVIKARIKTLPSKQAIVGRELNRRLLDQVSGLQPAGNQPLTEKLESDHVDSTGKAAD